jgi:hypothetical protein
VKKVLLKEVYPSFAEELANLLRDEPDLASTLDNLELVERCRCGDSFCSSFYTLPPPNGTWGPAHENLVLDSEKGMIILDVIDRKIGMIEVIDREDVRTRIMELLP